MMLDLNKEREAFEVLIDSEFQKMIGTARQLV